MKIIRILTLIAVIVGLCSVVLFSQRAATSTDFDSGQVTREIEIMKSIFKTALEMAERELNPGEGTRRSRSRIDWMDRSGGIGQVDGLYLHGQGVVFTVSAPTGLSVDSAALSEVQRQLEDMEVSDIVNAELLEAQMYLVQGQMEEFWHDLQEFYQMREGAVPEPPLPPAPPLPPDPPEVRGDAPEVVAASEADRKERLERTRAQLDQMKDRMREARTRLEEKSEQARVTRERMIEELIRVVATHGDTLHQLSADQFVNLVLLDQGERFGWTGAGLTGSTVLSIRKGDVLEYKSGAITLDEFRSRILKY